MRRLFAAFLVIGLVAPHAAEARAKIRVKFGSPAKAALPKAALPKAAPAARPATPAAAMPAVSRPAAAPAPALSGSGPGFAVSVPVVVPRFREGQGNAGREPAAAAAPVLPGIIPAAAPAAIAASPDQAEPRVPRGTLVPQLSRAAPVPKTIGGLTVLNP